MPKGKGRAWHDEELEDMRNLTQAEFRTKYPDRTDRAYYVKMYELGLQVSTHDAVLKARRMFIEQDAMQIEEPDPKRLLELTIALQEETRKLYQSTYTLNVRYTNNHPIGIAFFSDMHIGNIGTDYKQLERDIEIVRQCPYMYGYIGGDPVDNFILEKMIAASREDTIQVPAQWYLFEYFLKKLEGSILAVGSGNHDAWTRKVAGIDKVADIARKLRVVYTGQGGRINLTVGDHTYTVYRRHYARYWSSLNPVHAVKRMYDTGECTFDVGVIEHRHIGGSEVFWRHGRNRIGIVTGTYKVFDTYAQDLGFFGAQVSTPVVIFHPDRFLYEKRDDLESAAHELMTLGKYHYKQEEKGERLVVD